MSFEPTVHSSTAPGKAILFGEHAVVHGQPAIAVPVTQVCAAVRVHPAADGERRFVSAATGLDLDLSDAGPDFWGAALVTALEAACGCVLGSFRLEIESSIPVAAGLGSGAAIAVAAVRALAARIGFEPDLETVSRIAYEVEKIHHGTPSGIDNTTVTWSQPVYFRRGSPVEFIRPAAAFEFVIGLTGIPSPTGRVVADVRAAHQADPVRFDRIFSQIGRLTKNARAAIENGDPAELGRLMDRNHDLLCEMTVSSGELDRLVKAAREAGAEGAKLSGGGRGGNMLALAVPGRAEILENALRSAGAAGTIRTIVEMP
ncbi:MAG TPA: mevalonate kinase [Anaerolineales bacterium]|nr:mevalonate kinase [Anaerolineales bacterium]